MPTAVMVPAIAATQLALDTSGEQQCIVVDRARRVGYGSTDELSRHRRPGHAGSVSPLRIVLSPSRVALLLGGVLVAGVGTFLGGRSWAAGINDQAFTVSLGGLVAGLGAGLVLVAAVPTDHGARRRGGIALILAGTTFAGYAVGGSLDEMLLDQAAGWLIVDLAIAAIGGGVATAGWLVTTRRRPDAPDR